MEIAKVKQLLRDIVSDRSRRVTILRFSLMISVTVIVTFVEMIAMFSVMMKLYLWNLVLYSQNLPGEVCADDFDRLLVQG
jgi:hypothetical protein